MKYLCMKFCRNWTKVCDHNEDADEAKHEETFSVDLMMCNGG